MIIINCSQMYHTVIVFILIIIFIMIVFVIVIKLFLKLQQYPTHCLIIVIIFHINTFINIFMIIKYLADIYLFTLNSLLLG